MRTCVSDEWEWNCNKCMENVVDFPKLEYMVHAIHFNGSEFVRLGSCLNFPGGKKTMNVAGKHLKKMYSAIRVKET